MLNQLGRSVAFVATLFATMGTTETIAFADEPPTFDVDEFIRQATVTKYFLIVGTFRTYASAVRASERLSARTSLELRNEGVTLEGEELTYSAAVCDQNGWDYPCYVARGRYDDGAYVSVEPSGAYSGMTSGYFLVIAASGAGQSVRDVARSFGQRRISSYVRSAPVYVGCMH